MLFICLRLLVAGAGTHGSKLQCGGTGGPDGRFVGWGGVSDQSNLGPFAEGGKPVPPIRRLIQWATRNCRHQAPNTCSAGEEFWLCPSLRESWYAAHRSRRGPRRASDGAQKKKTPPGRHGDGKPRSGAHWC